MNRILAIVLMLFGLVLILGGCATTNYARIDAKGIHAITPYGIISAGWLIYEREAGEGKKEGPTIP